MELGDERPRLNDIRSRFGERVATVVEACSDSLSNTAAGEAKRGWQERKDLYIAHLRMAPADVLHVSLADKVHNARSIFRDLRRKDVGEAVWSRFSQPKERTIWYYRRLAETFREVLPGQLANELHDIVKALEG